MGDTMVSAAPAGMVAARDAAPRVGVSYKTITRQAEAGRIDGATRQEWPTRSGFRWIVPEAWVRAERRRRREGARRRQGVTT